MRKKYELLMNQINEGKYTGREILLTGAVLFLVGTLLGMNLQLLTMQRMQYMV